MGILGQKSEDMLKNDSVLHLKKKPDRYARKSYTMNSLGELM